MTKSVWFAMEKKSISVDQVKENLSINGQQAENVIKLLETIGVLGGKNEDGTHTVMMDKDAFINSVRGGAVSKAIKRAAGIESKLIGNTDAARRRLYNVSKKEKYVNVNKDILAKETKSIDKVDDMDKKISFKKKNRDDDMCL